MIKQAIDWVNIRLEEKSTIYGIVLICVGMTVLFPAILKIMAIAAIGYGIFKVVQQEK